MQTKNTTINNSYLIKYISEKFPELCIIDSFSRKFYVHGKIENQKIIIFDEEDYELDNKVKLNLPKKIMEKDSVFITKTPKGLSNYNFKNKVISTYFDIMEDFFALSHLEQKDLDILSSENKNQYTFLCLNNNPKLNRIKLIYKLAKKDLLKNSYTSFGEMNFVEEKLYFEKIKSKKINHQQRYSGYSRIIPEHQKQFIKYSDYDIKYNTTKYHPEKAFHTFGDIQCTTNFLNYFDIKENMDSNIVLIEETFLHTYYPCEKTFLPFFTQKIPIVISSHNAMSEIKKEGFDIFEDIVDFSYDSEENIDKRIERCVEDNEELLRTGIQNSKELKERFDYNFFHLKTFFEKQLKLLEDDIRSLLRK